MVSRHARPVRKAHGHMAMMAICIRYVCVCVLGICATHHMCGVYTHMQRDRSVAPGFFFATFAFTSQSVLDFSLCLCVYVHLLQSDFHSSAAATGAESRVRGHIE